MRWLAALLFVAVPALADVPQMVTVVVPVVGSSIGPRNVRWKTSIELFNDMRSEATVTLSLPTAADQPIILLTIPAGGVQRFTDVVGDAFALDNLLSPLVVQTLGRRSVRVVANAYGIGPAGLTTPQPIPVADPASFYPLRVLPGVSYSDSRRTNVGLVNLGEREAVFSIALRAQDGTTSGGIRAALPPNTMWHMAVQLLFPTIKPGDNYSILVETGARDTYVYGSAIDNATNEAQFIAAVVGSR